MTWGWTKRRRRRPRAGLGATASRRPVSAGPRSSREGQRRILIADPSPILRSGVQTMLAAHGEFEVHTAGDLAELQQAVAAHRPDAILVDVDLQPRGGIDAVACLSGFCEAPLFLWGLLPTDGQEAAARLAGASGFVRKDVPFVALTSTLRELAGSAGRAPKRHEELVAAGQDGVGS